jgi:hypothetical protein
MQLEYHLISTRLEQSNMVNRGGLQAKVNALRELLPPTVPARAGWGWLMPFILDRAFYKVESSSEFPS